MLVEQGQILGRQKPLRVAAGRYPQAKFHFLEAFCGTREREACHVMPKPYNTLASELRGDNLFGLVHLEILTAACYATMEHTAVLHGNHINNSRHEDKQ